MTSSNSPPQDSASAAHEMNVTQKDCVGINTSSFVAKNVTVNNYLKPTGHDDSTAFSPRMVKSDLFFQLYEARDKLVQSGRMTDVTLVCRDMEILAHKSILTAKSAYFSKKFSSDWDKTKDGRVELLTTGGEEMEVILHFMYIEKFFEVKEMSLLKKVVQASHRLQLNEVYDWCFKRLPDMVNTDNFLEVYDLAKLYEDAGQQEKTVKFLTEHFDQIAKSEQFLKFNELQMTKIVSLVDVFEVCMDSVIQGLIRWAEVENREEALLQIITSNQLMKYVSTDLIKELLGKETSVIKNSRIYVLLTGEATLRTLTVCNTTHMENQTKLLAFGVSKENQPSIATYDISSNAWHTPKVIPFSLNGFMSMVWFHGVIYVFGNDPATTKIIKYCPSTNTIVSFRDLQRRVKQPGVVVMNDFTYIVNGNYTNSRQGLQRFNPSSETCEELAQTNDAHTGPRVFVFSGCLHVLGSFWEQNSVERYDCDNNQWTKITSIPRDVNRCSSCIVGEKLFVVPSQTTLQYHVYDFSLNKWETKEFTGSVKYICCMMSFTVNGKHSLLCFDDNAIIHTCDVEAGNWLEKPNHPVTSIHCNHIWLI